MYIRRKVFSLLQDSETGEERYFSTTDVTLEQKEFGNKANKEATRRWKRQQASLESGLGEHTFDLATRSNNPKIASSLTKSQIRTGNRAEDAISNWNNKNRSITNGKTDINSMNLNERINRRAAERGGINGNKTYFTNDQRIKAKTNIANRNSAAATTLTPKNVSINKTSETSTNIINSMKGKWNNMGKAGKVGTIAAGTALAAGALYGAKKLIDKKKDKE